MPFTVTTTTTKPSTVLFFGELSEETLAAAINIARATESAPGFISHTRDDFAPNTRIYTSVWETEEDFYNWLDSRDNNPDHLARMHYNSNNNIVSVVTVSNT